MGVSALERVASLESLRAAWNDINTRSSGASRKTSGIDSESIQRFAVNTERNLIALRRQLLSNGGYPFSPLIARFVPKPDGKDRVICVPTVRDRIVQRAINNYLADGDRCSLANNVSYGFIPHRGVKNAVDYACRLRKKKPWAYKTDITSFFDEIDRGRLMEDIARKVKSSTLHCLLKRAVDTEIHEPLTERRKKIRKQGIREGRGVRQGMPLSPFFANLVLRDFDQAIEHQGVSMVRYADDLVIFAKSEDECTAIHDLCKELLGCIDLSIPEPAASKHERSKTKIYSPSQPAEFLGIGIKKAGKSNYEPYVLKTQLEKIRSRILSTSKIDEAMKKGQSLSGFLQSIDNSVIGYKDAYKHCRNHHLVEQTCRDAKTEAVKSVFRELGVDICTLSAEKKAFLGVT